MRNVNRLFQIIHMLRHHRVLTAEAIAEKLEVSVRTIYRDIDHLSASGIPIMSERGVGYKMMNGYELPPLTFTEEELIALRLGARMVQAWSEPRLQEAASSMLSKIDGVLSQTQRDVLDNVHLYALDAFIDDATRQKLAHFRQAVEQHQRVLIHYTSAQEASTQRTIRPLGVFYIGSRWLVGAWCELREGFRHFLLTRITHHEVVGTYDIDRTPGVDDLIAYETKRHKKTKA